MDNTLYVWAMLMAYKTLVLICGTFFSYLGYRLFRIDKASGVTNFEFGSTTDTDTASKIDLKSPRVSLRMQSSAPGIFFSLFGCVLILVSLYKGSSYESSPTSNTSTVTAIIPDKPPS